jgi:formylglycine-generating enzyme required for sulfatase activity
MSANSPTVDTAWHPLADGAPPEWASEWGQDRFGVFVAFRLGEVTQGMRWIPPGRFHIGSPPHEPGRYDNEGPRHTVVLSRGYWLFDSPCTQALWEAVMGKNPSRFVSPRRPVEQVSWDDVQSFLAEVNMRIPGLNLVVPSEAQWERACRAGTETALYTGPIKIIGKNKALALDPIAWYGGNSGVDFDLAEGRDSSGWPEKHYPSKEAGTRNVGEKQPNPWGLNDMLGNVWEWVQDTWHENYRGAPEDGRAWEAEAKQRAGRVIRGGSWRNYARGCRCAARSRSLPDSRNDYVGIRFARVQES